MNKLGRGPDCPFSVEEWPDIGDVCELPPPVLNIETGLLTVEFGRTALRLTTGLDLVRGRWPGEPRSLAEVPAHHDAGQGLQRFRFTGADLHSAAHYVLDGNRTTPGYCSVHSHDEDAELNIIIPSKQGIAYRVTDGSRVEEVYEPTPLWFPSGDPHCTMAESGNGVFVVARIPDSLYR